MKKFFAMISVLFVMGTTSVFALGIGAQGGFPIGGALTFKLDNKAPVFAVNAALGPVTGFGLTADYWLANKTFAKPFAYFYGVGVGGMMYTGDNFGYLSVGPRIFGGINCFLLDNVFELYLQAAWQPSFNIDINGKSGQAGFKPAYGGISAGFRFWF